MHAQLSGSIAFRYFFSASSSRSFLWLSSAVSVSSCVCLSLCLFLSLSLCLPLSMSLYLRKVLRETISGKRCFLCIYWTILQLTLSFLLSVIGITAWRTETERGWTMLMKHRRVFCFIVFPCFVNIVLLFSFLIDCFPYPVSRVYAFRLWFSCLLCVRFTICFHIIFFRPCQMIVVMRPTYWFWSCASWFCLSFLPSWLFYVAMHLSPSSFAVFSFNTVRSVGFHVAVLRYFMYTRSLSVDRFSFVSPSALLIPVSLLQLFWFPVGRAAVFSMKTVLWVPVLTLSRLCFGFRAFSHFSPRLWNVSPQTMTESESSRTVGIQLKGSFYISDSTVIHHSRSVCVLAICFPPTFFWY